MLTNVRANFACVARLTTLGLALLPVVSCDAPADNFRGHTRIGKVSLAVDVDSDGMDDDWETSHFGGLSEAASGDYDGDGMTNLEEFDNGFDPNVADSFNDADGDRYPNIHELRHSTDPNEYALR